ncbi:MAG: beta-ketoacyl synthase chain length factor [Bacteroidales bacterium]|nr:beta-ketoacyl synthase chain length factor [Bacteroidales bacterium]
MKTIYINSVNAILPSRGEEPDYKAVIRDANLRRRMSRIVKIGVASALQCLEPVCMHPDAIVTATALGCLADSEKFMSDLLDRDEDMLNPTAFIQSVFNTVGAQTALLNGIKSYNMTYVNRGSSFSSALLDALMLVSEGRHNVLVEAFDEVIPVSEDILRRLGKWNGAVEGAVSFLLSDSPCGDRSVALTDVRVNGCTDAGRVYDSMDWAVRMYDAVCSILDGKEENIRLSLPMADIVLSAYSLKSYSH